jgi:hypothetical protein
VFELVPQTTELPHRTDELFRKTFVPHTTEVPQITEVPQTTEVPVGTDELYWSVTVRVRGL